MPPQSKAKLLASEKQRYGQEMVRELLGRPDFGSDLGGQTALGEALGIVQSKVSAIKEGKATIGDKAYRKAAILLGKDAEAIGVWLRDSAPDEAWYLAMACPPEGPRHLGYGLEVETACAAPATAPEEGDDH